MPPPRIAFFDLDRTLLNGYSGYYAVLSLMQAGALKKRHLPKAIFYKIISKLYKGNVAKMYDVILADLAGWTLEEVMRIGEDCFLRDLKPRLYQEGIALLEKHRQAGDALYLVTSGPYMVVKAVGDFLGVNAEYAPRPVMKDGILQKELHGVLPYREGKLKIGQEIATTLGVPLSECYFYTDDSNDLALLQAVGFPHAVNPDRKLLRIAKTHAWPVLSFDARITL